MTQKILSVTGCEPQRVGEYPEQFQVGYANYLTKIRVARIEREEENLGQYGIVWFVAYAEDGSIIGKMNALNTAIIYYEKQE